MSFKTLNALVIVSLFVLPRGQIWGQAYCALRDPTRRIYESYPDATSFRSLVRTVDEQVRQQVSQELPFTIHFNELGRHTLYLPVQDGRPIGLVHARSEAGKWGLSEIVWSLTPGLQVEDFSFQRCRSRKRTAVETESFKRQLRGKSFSELKRMLTADGTALRPDQLNIQDESAELAATVVRSALKTIAVTRLTWARDLTVITPLYRAHHAFPTGAKVERVKTPYSERAKKVLAQLFRSDNDVTMSGIDQAGVIVLRVRDAAGKRLGHVIKTPWKSGDKQEVLWWKIRNDVVVDEVTAEGGWSTKEVQDAFEPVKGLAIADVKKCSTFAEIVGAEVLLLSRLN